MVDDTKKLYYVVIVLKHLWSTHQQKICRLYEKIGNQKKVAETLQVFNKLLRNP